METFTFSRSVACSSIQAPIPLLSLQFLPPRCNKLPIQAPVAICSLLLSPSSLSLHIHHRAVSLNPSLSLLAEAICRALGGRGGEELLHQAASGSRCGARRGRTASLACSVGRNASLRTPALACWRHSRSPSCRPPSSPALRWRDGQVWRWWRRDGGGDE
jgi:hypothetical protein